MPRYFFHIVERNGIVDRDLEGHEFSDADAARQEAHRVASDLVFDALADGTAARETIDVMDEWGRLVLRLACAG